MAVTTVLIGSGVHRKNSIEHKKSRSGKSYISEVRGVSKRSKPVIRPEPGTIPKPKTETGKQANPVVERVPVPKSPNIPKPKQRRKPKVDVRMKETSPKVKEKRVSTKPWSGTGKPKILLISDVKGWAWWIKSQYLKKYLSDEFEIFVGAALDKGAGASLDVKKYDLCITYGYSYLRLVNSLPKNRRVTGVTAHRKRNVIEPQMKNAGIVHANSMMLFKELKNMGIRKVHYVPNGVDEELFRIVKPIPEERSNIIVGHVGKECAEKGQNQFIKPAIAKAKADSTFNLENWTQKRPFEKMYEIYQEMDCFIVASTEDGTPNPALEAAACGRPIISNRIGNMPEFIKDGINGFLVNRRVDEYVEKIKWLKDNRDKMIKMGMEARKTVEKEWTWKHQSENYRRMFKEALGM